MQSSLSFNFETDNFDTDRLPASDWQRGLEPIDQTTMLAHEGKAWVSYEKEVSVPGPTSTISLSIYRLVLN